MIDTRQRVIKCICYVNREKRLKYTWLSKCQRIIGKMIRLKYLRIRSLNKIFLTFVVVTLVVENQNTNVRTFDIIYSFTIKLRNQRLCKLSFASAHCTDDTCIRMEYFIRISGMPEQWRTRTLVLTKQNADLFFLGFGFAGGARDNRFWIVRMFNRCIACLIVLMYYGFFRNFRGEFLQRFFVHFFLLLVFFYCFSMVCCIKFRKPWRKELTAFHIVGNLGYSFYQILITLTFRQLQNSNVGFFIYFTRNKTCGLLERNNRTNADVFVYVLRNLIVFV